MRTDIARGAEDDNNKIIQLGCAKMRKKTQQI